jgi:hypothetical protein
MNIGRLFVILDRLAEAEEYFSFAYMQGDTKIEIIENLNRIYAKRTKIYHCNWTISRLYELHAPEKVQLIARIRNSFIWGYFENAYNDALSNFELLKNNEEFLILSVQVATFLGKGKLLLVIFNDSSCKEIICSFSEASMSSYFLDIDINDCHRIAIVIDSKANCFLKEADAKFEEAIDICNLNYFTNENTLYPAGYYCDLGDLSFKPILKDREIKDPTLGSKFKMRYFMYEAANNDQFISGRNSEIINAYIRAANWIRKAEVENIQFNINSGNIKLRKYLTMLEIIEI